MDNSYILRDPDGDEVEFSACCARCDNPFSIEDAVWDDCDPDNRWVARDGYSYPPVQITIRTDAQVSVTRVTNEYGTGYTDANVCLDANSTWPYEIESDPDGYGIEFECHDSEVIYEIESDPWDETDTTCRYCGTSVKRSDHVRVLMIDSEEYTNEVPGWGGVEAEIQEVMEEDPVEADPLLSLLHQLSDG